MIMLQSSSLTSEENETDAKREKEKMKRETKAISFFTVLFFTPIFNNSQTEVSASCHCINTDPFTVGM